MITTSIFRLSMDAAISTSLPRLSTSEFNSKLYTYSYHPVGSFAFFSPIKPGGQIIKVRLSRFLAMSEAITDFPKPTTSAMITPLYSLIILKPWLTASI
ncbi:MAG: hypothetical protein BWY67_01580 [Bacteroidetes bacterium ADurb.Bin397]|nr:MAG: hypothetical protein BWY67_01580 [Bacteroidetes bacterium ADurb.Bin397]